MKMVLLGTSCVAALGALSSKALANPESGAVVGGAADISYSGNKLDVYQHTNRAVIDWRSFNIGASEHTQFHQPSAGSIVVNRINDMNPSSIDGRLSANGHVVLVNPNGVFFGKDSQIDVGSLTATTAGITTEDAMAGKLEFKQAGSTNGRIINEGRITARDAGLVTLVAPQVENSGVIEAKLGKVQLASAETMTLDMAGDGLLSVAVSSERLEGHVKNTGVIHADGGRVLISAAAARDIVDGLIVNTGKIRAKKGTVKLAAQGANNTAKAGASKVVQAGEIDVSGTDASFDQGGTVEITGDEIELSSTSIINANGMAGGGAVYIGGRYKGEGDLPTARLVTAMAGSRVRADAIQDGKGGTTILWADDTTRFDGDITTRGGAVGGDGGFVETSGKINLRVNGTVDVSSPGGQGGEWLLDPSNVFIVRPGGTVIGGGTTNPAMDDFIINADSIQTALAGGHVTITTNRAGAQPGNITVDAALNWTSANTLTLDAHNDVIVNQGITGRSIVFSVGNDVQLNAHLTSNLLNNGAVYFYNRNAGSAIGIGNGAAGALNLSTADLAHIQDGFGQIRFGNANTSVITANAASWNDELLLATSAAGSINIDGPQSLNNNRMFAYTRDLNMAADITGITNASGATFSTFSADNFNITGRFFVGSAAGVQGIYFRPNTTGRSFGIADSATCGGICDTKLTSSMLDKIMDGFGQILIANNITGGNGIDFGAYSWRDPLLGNTGSINSGAITISGVQNMNNNRFALTGGSAITINAELQNLGISSYMSADSFDINADILPAVAGYALSLSPASTGIMGGIGTGAAGTWHLDDAELAHIKNFGAIYFGYYPNFSNGARFDVLNINPYTWPYTASFAADTVRFNPGTHAFGARNLYVFSQNLPDFGTATITSTGEFAFGGNHATTVKDLGVGDGAAGDLVFSNALIDQIRNMGFSTLHFGAIEGGGGRIRHIDVHYLNWDKNVYFSTNGLGSVTFDNTVTMNNQRLRVNSPMVNFGGDINRGTGILDLIVNNINFPGAIISSAGRNGTFSLSSFGGSMMGIGDGASGVASYSTALMNKLMAGNFHQFSLVNGRPADFAAMTWAGMNILDIQLTNPTFSGIQDFGNTAVVIIRSLDPAINAALNGTGVLRFYGWDNAQTIGVGSGTAGQNIHFTDAELDRIAGTFSSVTFGLASYTHAVTVNKTTPWLYSPTFSTLGALTVSGAQNFGAHNATFLTSDLALNGNLTGTGNLTFNTISSGTGIGLGNGAAGGLNLDANELNRIGNTFSSVTFGGNAAPNNTIEMRAHTWNFAPTFLTSSAGMVNILGAQNFDAYKATFGTDNLNIGQTLSGTGTLEIGNTTVNTMRVGNGGVGTLQVDDTELALIQDGFSNLIFGNALTTSLQVRAGATWRDNVTFIGDTVSVNTAQNFGGNNATFRGNEIDFFANLSNGNQLQLTSRTATQGIEIGSTDGLLLNLTAAELAYIQNGWNNILIGGTDHDARIVVNEAVTFQDNTTLRNTPIAHVLDRAIDINAVITTTDNADLSLHGYSSGTSTHVHTGVHIGADMNIARDLIISAHAGYANSGNIVVGRDMSLNVTNMGIIGGNITVGRDFSYVQTAQNFWIGANKTLSAGRNITVNAGNNVGGTSINLGIGSIMHADGNIDLISRRIEFDSTAQLTGNSNGSSVLNFKESGEDNTMDIGHVGTSEWSMTDAELATIQNGFAKVVFGSAAMTGNAVVDSWDLTGKNFNVELYGNDITFQGAGYAVNLGTGDFMARAKDNGGDFGTVAVNARFVKGLGGASRLDLLADRDVVFTNADIATSVGSLNVQLNGDRNADKNGAISLTGSHITTNGGYFVAGGGSGTLFGADGIYGTADDAASTGADNVAVWGNAVYKDGIRISSSTISTDTGHILLQGHGGDNASDANYGVYFTGTSSGLQTTSGIITVRGVGAGNTSSSNNYGIVLASDASITSADGGITLHGSSDATGSGTANYGLYHAGTIRSNTGAVDITAVAGVNSNAFRMAGGLISSGTNILTLTGVGGIGESFVLSGGTIGGVGQSGNITLNTDSLQNTGTTINSTGIVHIKPRTASTTIGLGGGAGTLNLDDAELAMFNAGGKFIIGDAVNGTGDVTIASWDLTGQNYGVEVYGNDFTLAGMTLGGGDVLLRAKDNGGDVADISVTDAIANAGLGGLHLNADHNLLVDYAITTGGALEMTAANGEIRIGAVNLAANGLKANSDIVYTAASGAGVTRRLSAGTGTLNLQDIAAGDRNLDLIADNMTLGGAITTGAGRSLLVRSYTTNRAINLGGGAGGLDLDDTELSYLQTGGLLTIGTETTGTGTLTASTASFGSDVALYGGNIILNGLSSSGSIFARSNGAGNDITLNSVVSSDAAGNGITLVSADDFFNNAGAGALLTSNVGGRWIVYSERMDQNIRGGLIPDVPEFGVSYPTGPAGAGNRFLYSSTVRPTLTLSVNNGNVVYEQTYTIPPNNYTITGGLLSGDTQGNIGLSGDLAYATSYTPGVTLPSSTLYAGMITATQGTLTSALGYLFSPVIQAGDLLVSGIAPAPTPTVPVLPSTYRTAATQPTALLTSSSSGADAGAGVYGYGNSASRVDGSTTTNARAANGDSGGAGAQGRLALTFSEGYVFSTWGLPLDITPEIRARFALPEQGF